MLTMRLPGNVRWQLAVSFDSWTTARPRPYKLAADQGNALAQVKLAVFYENGSGGLPKDDREAARLQACRRSGKRSGASQSRCVLRDRAWRPTEGRPRGR